MKEVDNASCEMYDANSFLGAKKSVVVSWQVCDGKLNSSVCNNTLEAKNRTFPDSIYPMKYLVLFLSLLCSMSPLMAQDVVEEWECVEFVLLIPNWNNILATARIFEDRESGSIDVAGITHSTHFHVAGFERRWDFGSDNDDAGFGYSLIIKPDGTAGYYDFTSNDTADPDMFLTCREKNTDENSNLNEDMGNDDTETFITDSRTKLQCETAVRREMITKRILFDDTLSAPEKIIREKTMIEDCIRAVETHTQ